MNDGDRGDLCTTAVQCLHEVGGSLSALPKLIARIIHTRAWESRIDHGQLIQLGSLRELIELPPIQGWGEDVDVIENAIKHDAEALTLFRDAMLKPEGRQWEDVTVNNVNSKQRSAGNSKSYTLSRLSKQAPDLYQQVVAGELSANAAAIAAGFRKVKTPLEQLRHWWEKASGEEREQFIQSVTQ